MTFLDLRQLVSGWLDDKDNGYFTVADVKSYLNLAQQEVQKILIQAFEDKWVKCVQTTMFAFQREYQLPDDFRKLNRLEVIVEGSTVQNEAVQRLCKITRNQQDAFNGRNTGIPQAYFFENEKVVLYPAPDSQKVLRMNYTYRVTDMVADGDTPDIPDEHQEFIAVLATITGMTRDGREMSAMLKKKEQYLENIKRDAEERNIDEPRTVVQTEYDYD